MICQESRSRSFQTGIIVWTISIKVSNNQLTMSGILFRYNEPVSCLSMAPPPYEENLEEKRCKVIGDIVTEIQNMIDVPSLTSPIEVDDPS